MRERSTSRLDCCEHDQDVSICEDIYNGERCPECGLCQSKGFDSNGYRGPRASYAHTGCPEADEAPDEEAVFIWDADEFWQCRERTVDYNAKKVTR